MADLNRAGKSEKYGKTNLFDILEEFGAFGYGVGFVIYSLSLVVASIFIFMFWGQFLNNTVFIVFIHIPANYVVGGLIGFILLILYGKKLVTALVFLSTVKRKQGKTIDLVKFAKKYIPFFLKFLPSLILSFCFFLIKLLSISLVISSLILILLIGVGLVNYSENLFSIMSNLSIIGIALSLFSEIQSKLDKGGSYEKLLFVKIKTKVKDEINSEKFVEWAKDPYVEKMLNPGKYLEKKMEGKFKFLGKALKKLIKPMKGKTLFITYTPPDDKIIENIKLEIIHEDPKLSKHFEEFLKTKKRELVKNISKNTQFVELLNLIEKNILSNYEFFDELIQLNFKSLEWKVSKIKERKPKTWNDLVEKISFEIFNVLISKRI